MARSELTRRALLAVGLAAALLPGAAMAITDEERAALAEISGKLSGVTTMNGEFVSSSVSQPSTTVSPIMPNALRTIEAPSARKSPMPGACGMAAPSRTSITTGNCPSRMLCQRAPS